MLNGSPNKAIAVRAMIWLMLTAALEGVVGIRYGGRPAALTAIAMLPVFFLLVVVPIVLRGEGRRRI